MLIMGKALCVEAEDISVSSSQFCCEHKTAPKNSLKKINNPPPWGQNLAYSVYGIHLP